MKQEKTQPECQEISNSYIDTSRKNTTPRRTRAERLKQQDLSQTACTFDGDAKIAEEVVPSFKDDERYSLRDLLFPTGILLPEPPLTARGTLPKVRFDEAPKVIQLRKEYSVKRNQIQSQRSRDTYIDLPARVGDAVKHAFKLEKNKLLQKP